MCQIPDKLWHYPSSSRYWFITLDLSLSEEKTRCFPATGSNTQMGQSYNYMFSKIFYKNELNSFTFNNKTIEFILIGFLGEKKMKKIIFFPQACVTLNPSTTSCTNITFLLFYLASKKNCEPLPVPSSADRMSLKQLWFPTIDIWVSLDSIFLVSVFKYIISVSWIILIRLLELQDARNPSSES